VTSAREFFRQRVRDAVRQGNRARQVSALPERGNVGYQGAGDELVQGFQAACTAAGGQVHPVADPVAATSCILRLVETAQARSVLLCPNGTLAALDLSRHLAQRGIHVVEVDGTQLEERHFAADVAITGVDYLIAETGSLAMLARPDNPRSFSLLPPVHIAVADTSQLLPDLFDLFSRVRPDAVPSCITLITGPSKTGDIELRLVTGVHGPGEVHVVVM
jgi:L-lactate dehydrogenase complex protein LldG